MTAWTEQYTKRNQKLIKAQARNIAHRFVEDQRSGLFGRPLRALHHDSGETGILALQLEELMTEVYETEFAPTLLMQILPVDDTVSYAETIAYQQDTKVGEATELSHYGEDIRVVDVYSEKFVHLVVPYAAAHIMDVNSLRQAAYAGQPIEMKKEDASQMAISQALDTLGATGSTKKNVLGFINNTNVPTVAVITGAWTGASALQIYNDVDKLVSSVRDVTLQTRKANTLLCSEVQMGQMGQMLPNTNMNVAQSILRNTTIDRIQPWHKLSGAGAGPSDRLVAFEANASVIKERITQPFELFPPVLENLTYKTIAHARSAGTLIFKPLAIAFMDGC